EAPKPGERFELFDTVNTNVLMHGGRMLALVEAGARPVELDWNLDTIQHSALEGISQAFSAHPHQHPQTGNLHAICYNALDLEQIFHVQLGTDGRVAKTEAIAVQDGPSIHDCTVSENYVVVLDMPVTFNSPMALQGSAFPYRWNPEHPPRVGLLPLDSGPDGVLWFDAPSCYIFHTANAYETQDPVTGNPVVIMDAAVHDGMFQETVTGPEATVTSLQRWTFDLTRLRLSTQVISERYQEFPRINESLTGKQHRYIYSLSQQGRGTDDILSMANAYYKTDTRTGEQQVFDFGPNAVAGEFVFVPSADSAEEDDGYLMGYVIDAVNHHTELVILDARNFNQQQAELARVRVPHVIPPGFHGNWMER
ncbi:MAG: carotenoid oxygenase family protein, partial [Gammaproteobacteria bacterium]